MILNKNQIIEQINKTENSNEYNLLLPYNSSENLSINEYCLFIKPELICSKNNSTAIDIIIEKLKSFKQEIISISLIGNNYILNHKIMENHYGVVNKISRYGVAALSKDAIHRMNSIFVNDVASNIEFLGAHQFLERYTFFNSKTISVLCDNIQNIKLASGSHCAKFFIRGKPVVVFNGFYPEQLEHYTQSGSKIIVFIIRGNISWADIRNELTGSTNPAKASLKSIRGTLFQMRHNLEIEEISPGRNGIHVSAGPVEAMSEICNFMSNFNIKNIVEPDQTTFGKLLLKAGISHEQIKKFCQNPFYVIEGKKTYLFDLTEELDAKEAQKRISSLS